MSEFGNVKAAKLGKRPSVSGTVPEGSSMKSVVKDNTGKAGSASVRKGSAFGISPGSGPKKGKK